MAKLGSKLAVSVTRYGYAQAPAAAEPPFALCFAAEAARDAQLDCSEPRLCGGKSRLCAQKKQPHGQLAIGDHAR